MQSLTDWKPCPPPERLVLEGRYCRLEPLNPSVHGDALFAASMAPGAEDRFRYLGESPCDRTHFEAWLARAAAATDPLMSAVIDRATGRAEGRQSLMRIVPEHGVIEIGHVLWGPAIARTRVATESLFLAACYVFENLGYRRFEWKCHSENAPSRRAALRFGFQYEGIFRQHMVFKGGNRDTAWFAMMDHEWPALKAAYAGWLDAANFDERGQQRTTLSDWIKPARP